MSYTIRPIADKDHETVATQIRNEWTTTRLGYIDHIIESHGLPGFVAEIDGKFVGALTWRIYENCLQVVTVISDKEGLGIGSALLKEAEEEAKRQGIPRVLISTENSYIDALSFYQKRGYLLHRVHINVMGYLNGIRGWSAIPKIDTNGIPIRDQIDLIKKVA